MIYNCRRLIEFASQFYTLYPGDLVYTGTPEGVSPVKPGDNIVCRSSPALGELKITVRAMNAARVESDRRVPRRPNKRAFGRHSMLQIKRAGHSTLITPDIERMVDYFTRIVGLSLVARDKDRAILATKSGPEAIILERGSAVDAPRLSFQVAPGSDPGEIVARLKKAGVKSERRSDITPSIHEAVTFQDPKGTTLEIFADFDFAPDDATFNGVMPLKFGHIAYHLPRRAGPGEILLRHAGIPGVGLAR